MAIRYSHEHGYVLHTRPYSESSLLIDVFCREHGRFMLLAKGARRAKRSLRGMVMPFKPLFFSWSGRGQLPIMTNVEPNGFIGDLDRNALHSAYYLNELILKMLHRFDEHAELYDHYNHAVRGLARGDDAAKVLRVFEKKLLQETGFGLILDHETQTGEVIDREQRYDYVPEQGPIQSKAGVYGAITVDGATLQALDEEQFDTNKIKHQARALNRSVIYHQLGRKDLRSRRVLTQIRRYQKTATKTD